MVLENKLNITDSEVLAREEEIIAKKAAIDLFDSGMLDRSKPGSFAALSAFHHYLFKDLYDFAEKIRTVDLAKGNFRFASSLYLDAAIAQVEVMPQKTIDQIVEKYVEMNVVHPFREGNGRSLRIWLDQILKKEFGLVVDWSHIDKKQYFAAMERSPVKDKELKRLIRSVLTDQIDNRELYLKGIDQSFNFEGFSSYPARDLV